MKKVVGFILLMHLLACKNEPVKSKFFEGYVDYKVEAVALDNSELANQYVKLSGNSMRCYFKNDSYMREYFDSNNISTRKLLYQVKTNRFIYLNYQQPYYAFEQVDDGTAKKLVRNWRIVDSNLTKVVMGKNCHGFKCSYLIQSEQLSKVILTFYHTTDLPLEYVNFKNTSDPFLWYLSNKFPFVSLLFIEETVAKVKTTHTATRIVATPLSDTLFTVPTDKPLIHL